MTVKRRACTFAKPFFAGLLAMLVSGPGCGGDSGPLRPIGVELVGTWLDSRDPGDSLTLRADGSYRTEVDSVVIEGTWNVVDRILISRCPAVFTPIIAEDSLRFETVEVGCSLLGHCTFTGSGSELEDTDWRDEFGLTLRLGSDGAYTWGNEFEQGFWEREGDNVVVTAIIRAPYVVKGDVLTLRSLNSEIEDVTYDRRTD